MILAFETTLFTAVWILYAVIMALYLLYLFVKKDFLARLALVLQAAGVLLHLTTIVLRGIYAGHLPLTNSYEFASAFGFGLNLVALVFILRFRFPILGAFAYPIILLILGYASMQSREVRELMPALKSSWLGIHVSTAIISYGAFGVAFVLGIIYLLRGLFKPGGFFDRHVPEKEKLDLIGYRSVALGLVFLTFTMISGAIWAEQAWGSYWNWDPKETWSLVTWLIYAVYLHLRLVGKWKGKPAAIFAIAGFVSVLFTYLGVNTLLSGLHSYR